jgi:hypothetical protein
MEDVDKPFEAKIYPAFGKSTEEGYSWADDVFRFLD